MHHRDLTDAEWAEIGPLLPALRPTGGNKSIPSRNLLNGALWLEASGAPIDDLPARYGKGDSVTKRLRRWRQAGHLAALFDALDRLDLEPDRRELLRRALSGEPSADGTPPSVPIEESKPAADRQTADGSAERTAPAARKSAIPGKARMPRTADSPRVADDRRTADGADGSDGGPTARTPDPADRAVGQLTKTSRTITNLARAGRRWRGLTSPTAWMPYVWEPLRPIVASIAMLALTLSLLAAALTPWGGVIDWIAARRQWFQHSPAPAPAPSPPARDSHIP